MVSDPVIRSGFVPLDYAEQPVEEMQRRAAAFCARMQRRRSVRCFSDRSVPRDVIEHCVRAAGTAPSGANQQPWHFVVVGTAEVKHRIRAAAEEVERAFYGRQAPQDWLDKLVPLGTGPHKPFLEAASHLIAVFVQRYGLAGDGSRVNHYYALESVGIATGVLITAIHNAGLVALPYTPSPMGFLREILGRPENERPFLLLTVGYPVEDAVVPDIARKPLEEIATFI